MKHKFSIVRRLQAYTANKTDIWCYTHIIINQRIIVVNKLKYIESTIIIQWYLVYVLG